MTKDEMNKQLLQQVNSLTSTCMETNPEGTAQTYIFLVDNQDIALNEKNNFL